MLELKRIYWTRKSLHLAMLASVIWLLAAAILAATHSAISQRPTSLIDVLRPLFDAVLAADTAPGLLIIVLVVAAAVIRGSDVRRRDPLRRFTRQQRREGMARADWQCEMEAGFHRRCSRPVEHGDHFYPWSKGGATSLQNFVAACSRCNRAKGARIPSPGQQKRLERRRLVYVDAHELVAVGERRELT
ncbi:HNH endonuclease signature motif containing protein [Arthrobacter sp. AZCC_0090]|uniref:HNH endonuclease signature motif containing protein n=1 Tax=Arthrobacter sp. AZCC_0090 TaxID=2735881 RepID=UPI00161CCAC1|nr:HNH endonuclease [Arthrobacter sp. AZCC_0090]MBB6404212.1 5-methylcytosine-specific restriction endonuclease McrA [Arthrobacter sp. AZCC_0090]